MKYTELQSTGVVFYSSITFTNIKLSTKWRNTEIGHLNWLLRHLLRSHFFVVGKDPVN